MLIAFDLNGEPAVMHYLAKDQSPEAITREIKRAHGITAPWRAITTQEYAAIRAARPKPQPQQPQPVTDNAVINEAFASLADAIAVVNQKADLANAKVEALADVTRKTDISGSDDL